VLGWVGYRWRDRNQQTERKPGDEVFAHFAIGSRWRSFHVEIATDLLFGQSSELLGLELPSDSRRLRQVQPTIGYGVGPGTFEATALIPIAGKNLPSGPGGSLGYRLTWGGS
jgi:hypothetical protein